MSIGRVPSVGERGCRCLVCTLCVFVFVLVVDLLSECVTINLFCKCRI
jgi:hypothetical protein